MFNGAKIGCRIEKCKFKINILIKNLKLKARNGKAGL